jgi:hypothetical protein
MRPNQEYAVEALIVLGALRAVRFRLREQLGLRVRTEGGESRRHREERKERKGKERKGREGMEGREGKERNGREGKEGGRCRFGEERARGASEVAASSCALFRSVVGWSGGIRCRETKGEERREGERREAKGDNGTEGRTTGNRETKWEEMGGNGGREKGAGSEKEGRGRGEKKEREGEGERGREQEEQLDQQRGAD